MNKPKLCLTTKEAAEMLSVSLPTVYKLIEIEDFPRVYIGKKIIIPIEKLKLWLDRHNGEQVLLENDDKGEKQ